MGEIREKGGGEDKRLPLVRGETDMARRKMEVSKGTRVLSCCLQGHTNWGGLHCHLGHLDLRGQAVAGGHA